MAKRSECCFIQCEYLYTLLASPFNVNTVVSKGNWEAIWHVCHLADCAEAELGASE